MVSTEEYNKALEITEELANTNRWLGNDYKNSNYYREYLDKVNEDLKAQTLINR